MIRRAIALGLAFAFIVTVVPLKFSVTVGAYDFDMPEDPVNTAIAPHFSRVVYTLEEPAYSTSCDARGYFKASVGTPTISIADSRLVISAGSSTQSCVVLSKVDVPAINQTRAYYEMCLQLSSTVAYVNISLYDTGANDWINLSAQSGAWYYDYDSGAQQKGVLYSPAAIDTDYVVAFELTDSSVTMYLYSSTGALLADKYVATNLLVGGDLDEIRFELAGASSNTISVDYLYVLGQKPASNSLSTTATVGTFIADDSLSEKRVDLDPTALTMDQSLREEMFGFSEAPFTSSTVTNEQLITALGAQNIHQQRAAGRLVAEGYDNLRDSVQEELYSYIATLESCEESEVYLVDYYIDYMQMKVKIHDEISDRISDMYEETAEPLMDALGRTLSDTASVSMLTLPAYMSDDLTDQNVLDEANGDSLWFSSAISEICRGIGGWFDDPLGLESTQEEMLKYLRDQQKAVEDAYNSALDRADWAYNDTKDALEEWQKSTEEKYDQVYGLLLNYMSVSQAQFTQLTDSYDEAQDRFERTMSSYYAYTTQQFEATNAIIARLLLQNQDLSQAQTNLTQYFAGQVAKTNEVVMNLTSTLVSQLDAASFWGDVMDGGKPASEPLTFSSFFGNTMSTWTWVFVVAFVCIVIVALLMMFMRKGKPKRRSKQ